MRILHLYKDYPPVIGGIEYYVRALAEAQAARGHDVTVLAANPGRLTTDRTVDGVRVVLAGRLATLASTPISPAMFVQLARLDADVAHLHFPYPPGEIAQLLLGRARRIVITYHSDIVRQRRLRWIYGPLLGRVLARADRIIVTSQAYLDSSPRLQAVRGKCSVVPIGVDLNRFAVPAGAASDLGRLFDLPDARPVLLFVGRLRYYKGLDVLIAALREVPGAHLLVVGDGPTRGRCEHLAVRLGVRARATFAGQVSDEIVTRCYLGADIFVLPSTSRAEAFGTAIVEAMAAGLPVISTEVGTGTSWVNVHGETGFVVPHSDRLALAEAIRTLVADESLRRDMGARARLRAKATFDVSLMVDAVEGVYREVLDSDATASPASPSRGIERQAPRA